MRRLKTVLLAGVLLAGGLFSLNVPPQASAATDGTPVCTGDVFSKECEVEYEDQQNQGGGGGSDDGGSGGGGSGPEVCSYGGKTVPCDTSLGYWSAEMGCYVQLADPQPNQTPPGSNPEENADPESNAGAWYYCFDVTCLDTGYDNTDDACRQLIWLDNPPETMPITPFEAARAVLARLTINAIDIGMAPQVNPELGHRRTHVGVPVWLWVNNPSPETYDGYEVTDSEGGLSVTGTVRVQSIDWDMGNGDIRTCNSAGTAYTAGFGFTESPTCGYLYQQTSEAQAGDRYHVTATSHWIFEWEAGGMTGTIPVEVSTATDVEVNELQTVNIDPNG